MPTVRSDAPAEGTRADLTLHGVDREGQGHVWPEAERTQEHSDFEADVQWESLIYAAVANCGEVDGRQECVTSQPAHPLPEPSGTLSIACCLLLVAVLHRLVAPR